MIKKIALISLVAITAACAQNPGSITPADVGDPYARVACSQARHELVVEKANLAALSEKQNNAVSGDAIGVFLLGVPVSSLAGGDKSSEIAVSKGKILSLESRVANCR